MDVMLFSNLKAIRESLGLSSKSEKVDQPTAFGLAITRVSGKTLRTPSGQEKAHFWR